MRKKNIYGGGRGGRGRGTRGGAGYRGGTKRNHDGEFKFPPRNAWHGVGEPGNRDGFQSMGLNRNSGSFGMSASKNFQQQNNRGDMRGGRGAWRGHQANSGQIDNSNRYSNWMKHQMSKLGSSNSLQAAKSNQMPYNNRQSQPSHNNPFPPQAQFHGNNSKMSGNMSSNMPRNMSGNMPGNMSGNIPGNMSGNMPPPFDNRVQDNRPSPQILQSNNQEMLNAKPQMQKMWDQVQQSVAESMNQAMQQSMLEAFQQIGGAIEDPVSTSGGFSSNVDSTSNTGQAGSFGNSGQNNMMGNVGGAEI